MQPFLFDVLFPKTTQTRFFAILLSNASKGQLSRDFSQALAPVKQAFLSSDTPRFRKKSPEACGSCYQTIDVSNSPKPDEFIIERVCASLDMAYQRLLRCSI